MKPNKKSLSIILTLIILSTICSAKINIPINASASISVSIAADEETYNRGDTVTFTAQVVTVGLGGDCILDEVNLGIADGSSKTCDLPKDDGYREDYGDCNVTVNVSEEHPFDCISYGGNNTYDYVIEWVVPSTFEADLYTSSLIVTYNSAYYTDNDTFTVVVPATTTTTTLRITSGGGGGGGGGVTYSAKPKISCFDGILNCHDGACEEDIDCGGPCKACPSCSDGLQNQGETGIDCGGPCSPCEVVTTTTKAVTTRVTTTTKMTTTTMPEVTTTTQVRLISTTTLATTPGIPLGIMEGVILLVLIVLVTITFLIQTGRV